MDYELACFDTKRIMVEDAETDVVKGAGVGLIKRLAKISRGSFRPIILGEELKEHEENPPQESGQNKRMWSSLTVSFKYGKKHDVKIFFYRITSIPSFGISAALHASDLPLSPVFQKH